MVDETYILKFLQCPRGFPGMRQLNHLIKAYIRKVPWESVFRMVKRASTSNLSQCPRWPDEFWHDVINLGGGGTCFESNYAFFQLLKKIGYSGYLTINDIGGQRGCHSAIIIELNGRKVLIDVAIPLLVSLPIDPMRITKRTTWLHTYTVHPDGENRYQIQRSRHPKPNIYTLIDKPVNDEIYRSIIEEDYGEKGLYLNRVVLIKVINERLWRFSSSDIPYRLESFGRDGKQEIPICPAQAPKVLAERFEMDECKIETAMRLVNLGLNLIF
jgi:hypothetical protein